jgi:hypothetical protein
MIYPEKMNSFYLDKANEYSFTGQHLILLDWFVRFMDSGKMKTTVRKSNHETYYWIKYDYALERLPILGSHYLVRKYLDELCGNIESKKNPNLIYPLEKYVCPDKLGTGTYTFFRIIKKGYLYLTTEIKSKTFASEKITKEPKMTTLVPKSMINKHHQIKKATHIVTDLKPKTRKILEELLVQGSPFSHRLNPPGEPITKTLLNIEKKIQSLYMGTFLKDFKLDEGWLRGKDLSVFDDMKGQWDVISDYLFEAANKYKKWEDKKTKSIDTWLFNPRTNKSTFLTAISMSKPEQDFAAEKMLDKIAKNDPKSAKRIAKLLDERRGWGNSYVCVESLYSTLQYLNKNWYTLKANNKETWHYKYPAEVLSNYGIFLYMQKLPDPKYMNVNGFLWKKFMEHFYYETNIDLEITA